MNPAPSSAPDYTSLTIGQLIGLNLARLYAWCLRLQASGATRAPRDLARMVISTDAMVHSYVRMLASNQLERAGISFAATAMRTPIWQRADSLVCSREPEVHIERAQGCEQTTSAELIDRLKNTIENFQRAETLASHLARVIVCALAYLEPAERISHAFYEAEEPAFPTLIQLSIRQEPWPPPFWIPDLRPGQLLREGRSPPKSFPGAPDLIRGHPGPRTNKRHSFAGITSDRAGLGGYGINPLN